MNIKEQPAEFFEFFSIVDVACFQSNIKIKNGSPRAMHAVCQSISKLLSFCVFDFKTQDLEKGLPFCDFY